MADHELVREAEDPATTAARLQELAQLDRGLWVALASNPSTYPGLLEWLGEHGDESVRAAIAGRPGTTSAPPAPPSATAGTRRRNTLVIAVVAAVLILLVGGAAALALGSGGDDSDTSTSRMERTGDGADDPAVPGVSPTTGAPAEPGDDAEFCVVMQKVQDPDFGPTGAGGADFADQLETMKETYADLEAAAPAELKEDASALKDYIDSLTDVAAGDPSALEQDSDSFVEAVTSLSTYYYQHCE